MKHLYIVANWKSYKTEYEAEKWFQELASFNQDIETNKEIIICPPFTLLSIANTLIQKHQLPFKLGAQNISPFDEGSYTGEVNGRQIKEVSGYVIIGHSERRKYLHEDDEILEKKVKMAIHFGLIPIFCVEDSKISIPAGVSIVAYEPIASIGTGNPEDPLHANKIAEEIKTKNSDVISVLYGGSVDSKNVQMFVKASDIDGVLVGGASLDAKEFLSIIHNA